jgi:hypothetical protein
MTMTTRQEMIKALTQNEIDWITGDPSFENVQDVVDFFANGGFNKLSDAEIEGQYLNLTA